MKKNLLLFCIVFLIIICGIFYYYKISYLNISSPLVQNLYKQVHPTEDVFVFYDFYKNEKFSNEYILAVGLKMYLENYPNAISIPKEEVEKNIYEVFGESISFSHATAYLLVDNYCGYMYNSENNQYEILSGCGGSADKFYRQIVKVARDKNQLVLYEKSIFVEYATGMEGDYYTIYNNVIDKKIIKKDSGFVINLDDFLEEASTYKYIFEKEKGHYIFKSIALVK